jgi:transposase
MADESNVTTQAVKLILYLLYNRERTAGSFMEELPPLDQLSSEQKDQLIIHLFALIKELRQRIAFLERENAELKARLSSNSQNSHKPPSSDGFKKPKHPKPKSERPSGAQKGHIGHALKESDHPDRVIKHPIKQCPHCARSLGEENHLYWKKAQVFDIPELKIEVEEHLIEECFCPNCQKACSADLPLKLRFGVQYGPRIQAFLIYLRNYHYLSSQRVVEFFQDIFQHTLSEGVIYQSQMNGKAHLEPFEKLLKNALKEASLNHADETTLRLERKNHWLHVLSNRWSTYLYIHKKRGCEAIDEMDILPNFRGILVHDHFKPYFKYGYEHSLCNAHHLRELQAVIDSTGHSWADLMQKLLKEIKEAKEANKLLSSTKKAFSEKYNRIIYLGYKEQKERSPPCRPKEICLLDRLKNYKTQTLLFMQKEEVPFDNNQAERDIRMMKLKMKISGCFRSPLAAKSFCLIRSYISTIKKNGMAIFQSLVDLFCPSSPSLFSTIRFY